MLSIYHLLCLIWFIQCSVFNYFNCNLILVILISFVLGVVFNDWLTKLLKFNDQLSQTGTIQLQHAMEGFYLLRGNGRKLIFIDGKQNKEKLPTSTSIAPPCGTT